MKVEVEIPDELIPFFELEAKNRKLTLTELVEAKVFAQSHLVKGDWEAAPPEMVTTPGVVPETLANGFTEGAHGDDEPPKVA